MSWEVSIFLILFGLVGNAFFAGLETGVISINRFRLKHRVHKQVEGASILQMFLDKPDHYLGTTLVGTNICMVMASVTATSLAQRHFGALGAGGATVVMTILILICCEYLPKAYFQSKPFVRSRPFASLLHYSGVVLYPISRMIIFFARILVPTPSSKKDEDNPLITKEELKHLTHETEKSGELSASDRRMINAVLELSHRTCSDIMVPRERMVLVHPDTPVEELKEISRTRHINRFPVFSEDEQRFIGIVPIFDVLRDSNPGDKTAANYMRSPQFISATTPADEMIPRMRLSRQPMALVTGEQGEVIGLITVEVVLQQIVGDL